MPHVCSAVPPRDEKPAPALPFAAGAKGKLSVPEVSPSTEDAAVPAVQMSLPKASSAAPHRNLSSLCREMHFLLSAFSLATPLFLIL